MPKKDDFVDNLLKGDIFNKSLAKISKGYRTTDHLGIVTAVGILGCYQELIRIRSILQGKPVENARKVAPVQSEEEFDRKVDENIKRIRAEQEKAKKDKKEEPEEMEFVEETDDDDDDDEDVTGVDVEETEDDDEEGEEEVVEKKKDKKAKNKKPLKRRTGKKISKKGKKK